MLAIVASASAVGAETDEDALAAMWAEVEAAEADNARMRREVDEIRADNDVDWLTEARTAEIRNIVSEVLTDADTRSSLLGSGFVAGWDGGFVLRDPNGRFSLNIGAIMQTRFAYNFQDSAVNDRHIWGLELPRSRLTLRGHVVRPELTYKVEMGVTNNDFEQPVDGLYFSLDTWLRYALTDGFYIRFGRMKLPFSREELVSSAYQQAVERSQVNENLHLTRAEGVEFTWSWNVQKLSVAWSDGGSDVVGFNNLIGTSTANTDALENDSEYAISMRYERLFAGEWQQFRDFTSPPGDEYGLLGGLGMHVQDTEADGRISLLRNETFWFMTTADISAEYGGANIFVSGTYTYIDQPSFGQFHIVGIVGQAGVYVAPKWELFARYEYGVWDYDRIDISDLALATLGCNYYIDGHDLKWTTDVMFAFDQIETAWDGAPPGQNSRTDIRVDSNFGDDKNQFVFRTQLQLLF